MDIKYLSDPKGTVTGVFIPLAEWQRLKQQYGIVEAAEATPATKLQQGLGEALRKAGLPEEGE